MRLAKDKANELRKRLWVEVGSGEVQGREE
jgi:hypothetical protein